MAISDALYVVEDWISEHYFTSDDASKTFTARTKALMQEWRSTGEDDPDWRSPRERFTSARTGLVSRLLELQADAAALPENAHPDQRRELLGERSVAFADELRTILGYTVDTGDEAAPGRWDVTTTGPLRRFATRGVDEAPLAMLDALAADDVQDVLAKQAGHLPADVVLGEGTEDEQRLTTVPQVLSALAISQDAPEFLLVLAGRFAVLTSSQLWPQGRYLVADFQTIAERNDLKRGGEVERMLAALSADSLAPDANSQIWWTGTVQESIDNAVGVSEDLRDGVRESIEIIANEVIRRREAKGLDPLPQDKAQNLALQSLRYLYRILFLLYAEASPELGVLPVGAPEYQAGYSVDRLRDLTQREVPLDAAHGTYLYSSLQILFDLINRGHHPKDAQADGPAEHGSGALVFENLDADLFREDRTALIDEVELGNQALQAVLENLLLSRVKKGKNRGFISYVALGINQLGAVYESLMSYTGSFADQDLVEVAKGGDPKDGSWVVPEDVIDESMTQHLVMVEDETGRKVPRTYRHGEFVFRLSGRARQQSASYYSPEVITSFTVSQGLAELLDPVITDETDLPEGTVVFDDENFDHEPIRRRRTTAAEILEMSICEPALGSGAFAIEAVRQLAAEYLTRRQDELDQRIDPEQYAEELQRVKAFIALHNVYGVDLNSTAVELAEVSLWLDTMAPGLKAPWFGLRLRAGNSLIGARHAVYSADTLKGARLKAVIETAPENLPVTTVHDQPDADGIRAGVDGRIFHFLLPGEGWLAAASDAEIKKLAPDVAKELRDHAKGWMSKLTKPQIAQLEKLSQRVEELWGLALRRIRAAEEASRRAIPVWGAETSEGGEVTRKQIEETLADANSAYQRLRLVMNAWCALWFWPVLPEDDVAPPTFHQWLETVQKILGTSLEVVKHKNKRRDPGADQRAFGSARDWDELDMVEMMFGVGGAANIEQLVKDTKWLKRCVEIATEQRFFHWELDFAAAFDRGGFDLQVGNPPWVRPDLDVAALLGEFDPWWVLANKPSNAEKKERREQTLDRDGALGAVLTGSRDVAAMAEFVGSDAMFPEMQGTRPDLYRNFMARTWAHAADTGIVTLVHPPTHLTDARGYALRLATYGRLRRHWRFINEKMLFKEIIDKIVYSVNVYGVSRAVDFLSAVSMYHPSVVEGSLRHDGSGPEPGFKNAEGNWDLSPHRARVQRNRREQLELWHSLMESGNAGVAVESSRMLSSVNHAAAAALEVLSRSTKVGSLAPQFSTGWNETTDRTKGRFESRWGVPESWSEAILQGPYFHVGNPFASERNETMGGNQDYSSHDLEVLPTSAIPATEYKPLFGEQREASGEIVADTTVYDAAYGTWTYQVDREGKTVTEETPVRDRYRMMWRAMAATTGERTLVPAIYPPGTAGVHSVSSYGLPGASKRSLVLMSAAASSLLSDFMVRSSVGSAISPSAVDRLPMLSETHDLATSAVLRTLRLNSLTTAYADLWRDAYDPSFTCDAWAGGLDRPNRPALGDVGPEWSMTSPLRIDEDRRQALVEIDAIMAIVTGISIDDLVTIYRTQFGVLNDYDRGEGKKAYIFDANGRLIPSSVRTAWNKAGRPETGLPLEDRTAVHPSATGTGRTIVYEQPFRILDREADMRQAYDEFTRRMEENGT
ncbi:restriction endonuclease [Brachybacterium paraconglomeratum]|uniref:restriction endonuclease n=1 Tax=Brachybacterium paraconglomeratum TaxID=173362 RepID=UPI0021A3557A|nr:restriction endonuclease [Brachybacterium paraconglomeratum]MCT1908324.1 restriction endonuclease [Brachybacterium paraconglomeratum]